MKSLPPLALVLASLAVPAVAGTGDVLRVNADLVNLRAGPSDAASVRDRIARGTEVIELRRDAGWYGVRVVETGQEGWIYGRLLDQVATSELGVPPPDTGFASISQDFDRMMHRVSQNFGAPLFESVATSDNALTLTPTRAWLRGSSTHAQVLAVAATHQMWKTHQNGSDVRVVLLDENGEEYIVMEDVGDDAPNISVRDVASGRDSQG